VLPSLKTTLPVTAPPWVAITVAVSVIGRPYVEGFSDDAILVEVCPLTSIVKLIDFCVSVLFALSVLKKVTVCEPAADTVNAPP
jgi:hypothetical protein